RGFCSVFAGTRPKGRPPRLSVPACRHDSRPERQTKFLNTEKLESITSSWRESVIKERTMKAAASIFFLLLMIAGCPFPLHAQDKATPRDLVQKVREARDFLAASGQAGIKEFNRKDGRGVWKDTYIFIIDMESVTILAHPVNPLLLGRNQIGLKDIKGNFFFIQFCEKAREEGGGWVEYWWPKPGQQAPSRKISYVVRVPGTSLMLGAGLYDENVSLEELNKLVRDSR
ncbi:MAG: cache domain-containing protein, partial [Syntrophobacteraceae bacterium]